MAITITEVRQVRKFNYSSENPSGRALYDVFFSTDTTAEYADYVTKLNMCFGATHPGGSGDITDTVPAFGDKLSNGVTEFDTYVRNVSPQIYQGQNNWWRVTVTYGQPDNDDGAGGNDAQQFDDDPENTAPTFTWGQQSYQRTIWEDKTPVADGGPFSICASSGQAFTTLPKVDDSFLTLTVSRRTAAGAYDPTVAKPLINTVNDAPLTLDGFTFPKGEVRLYAWKSVKKTAYVTKPPAAPVLKTYNDETRVYYIKEGGWIGEVLDQGFFELFDDGVSSQYVKRHITEFGEKVRTPQPLDGDGAKLYNEKGELVNTVKTNTPIGNLGRPGVRELKVNANGNVLAMLQFNFYGFSDLSVLGDN